MIIVAGGDSFVWGSELADCPHGGPDGYSRSTFPALLSRDYEYRCVAYPGLGNKEISRRVMEECQQTRGFVIVSWSWPTRDDLLSSDKEILQLQEFLEHHNFGYMFTCADNCVVTGHPEINWDKWFLFPVIPLSGWHPNEDPRGFCQWAMEHKYKLAPRDKHPLEQAHADAAKLMQGKFNEMVKEYLEQNNIRNTIS